MDARPNYQVGGICRKFLTLLPVTKAEAIQTLLECDWLDKACKNINREEWEELRQRFWAAILEQREDIFMNIRDIQFYAVRVVINQNILLKKESALVADKELEEIPDEPYKGIDGAIIQKDVALGKIPMYDRVIYKLHEKGVSRRAISRFTKIDRNEVNRTINRVKLYIATNVKYERASD